MTESRLTQSIYTSLVSEDFEVFVISQSQPFETNWVGQLQDALKSCDFYILMLCAHTASSEVLLQEMRTVKAIQTTRAHAKPTIIPIRVEFPFEEPLNFELRGYLQRVQQYLWRSPQDTDQILQQIFRILKSEPSTRQQSPAESGPAILATIPPIANNPKAPPNPC
ncbi:MAG: TIR domain-containing protein [Acaryochloridaceae cyanobacterium RL_2_7]|nr:TIR domain-containing protein [Acaryochloridaceae cyanobacterium RL_2_7]